MNGNHKFIRFDWAAKRMLRDKANFGVLEGLLTVLLGEKITIDQILESESNMQKRVKDWAALKAVIRDDVAKFIYKETKRKPMILPVIMDI